MWFIAIQMHLLWDGLLVKKWSLDSSLKLKTKTWERLVHCVILKQNPGFFPRNPLKISEL